MEKDSVSLISLANRLPPFICRYVARKKHGHEPLSHTDISKASKLSRSYVAELSRRKNWNGIPIDVVERFSRGCGVNLMVPWKTLEFLRQSKKHHIEGATSAQRRFIFSLFDQPKDKSIGLSRSTPRGRVESSAS